MKKKNLFIPVPIHFQVPTYHFLNSRLKLPTELTIRKPAAASVQMSCSPLLFPAGLYSDSCEIQAPQVLVSSSVLDCQAHFQQAPDHPHAPREPHGCWHKAPFSLHTQRTSGPTRRERYEYVIFTPNINRNEHFLNISPQILLHNLLCWLSNFKCALHI